MNRIELLKKIDQHKDDLKTLDVTLLIIGRKCLLEKRVDPTIPVLVRLKKDTYEAYNRVQEYLIKNIYEHIEVIPEGSFEVAVDDHFKSHTIKIEI